ncbi:MAG: hypothetical protein J3R72DRAFT_453924 [Linnemannia gamsii]|nr:MAG: hypothetical protein J3R72DRAFT_453924 [Linnemannia gamsii]
MSSSSSLLISFRSLAPCPASWILLFASFRSLVACFMGLLSPSCLLDPALIVHHTRPFFFSFLHCLIFFSLSMVPFRTCLLYFSRMANIRTHNQTNSKSPSPRAALFNNKQKNAEHYTHTPFFCRLAIGDMKT